MSPPTRTSALLLALLPSCVGLPDGVVVGASYGVGDLRGASSGDHLLDSRVATVYVEPHFPIRYPWEREEEPDYLRGLRYLTSAPTPIAQSGSVDDPAPEEDEGGYVAIPGLGRFDVKVPAGDPQMLLAMAVVLLSCGLLLWLWLRNRRRRR